MIHATLGNRKNQRPSIGLLSSPAKTRGGTAVEGARMAEAQRSPFGELVFQHRRRLGLTQQELADHTEDISASAEGENIGAVSITRRTVSTHESRMADPSGWISPRPSNVRALIAAFELTPGSPSHTAFIEAAQASFSDGALSASGGLDRSEPEFVSASREPHMTRLRQAVDDAVAGTPGVVILTAGSGVGKTRLLEEICRESVERHAGLVTVWASCTGRGGVTDMHQPLRQMLGLMVGDVKVVSERQRVSGANTARLINRVPAAISAIETEGRGLMHRCLFVEALRNPELAAIDNDPVRRSVDMLIEAEPDPSQSSSDTYDQLFQVLASYAKAGPVALVLDSLHRADSGTIRAQSHLLRQLRQHRLPLVVLGSVWPAEERVIQPEQRNRLLKLRRLASRLFPDSLLDLSTTVGGDAGRAFVEAAVASSGQVVSPDKLDTLARLTAGLPLLVTGLLRMHPRDDDRASATDDRPAETDDWASQIPPEVWLMFAEQVATLSGELPPLLSAASVQGNAFSAETLMSVLDLSRADFIEMVDMNLVQRDRLLVPGGRLTIEGQAVHEYQFFHGLLRDFVYERMNEMERAYYHTATANALIRTFGHKDHHATDEIAFHYEQAGDQSRAAVAYLHAGDHAMNLRDFDRAIRHYERIGHLRVRRSDPATFIYSLIGLGNCARSLGQQSRGRNVLKKALGLARRHDDPIIEGHALEALAMLDFDAGEMQAGMDRLTAVIDLWRSSDHDEAGRAMANLSYLLYGLGRYEEAIAVAEQGIVTATRIGDDRMWIDAAIGLANCWLDLGLYEEAISQYEHCARRCDGVVDTHREHICWLNISLAEIEMARWDRALAIIEQKLISAPGLGSHLTGAAEYSLGLIAEGRRDPQSAREHYQASRAIQEATEQQGLLVDSLAGLLRTAMSRADLEQAQALRDDIRTRIDQRGLDGIEHIGKLFAPLIESSIALGDLASARAFAAQATAFLGGRADRISDPVHRESYLMVTARRRVFELAATLDES